MLLKGEGASADHIVVGGAEWSTLAHDAFPAQEFDFMLSNPPYGKSWKNDLARMGGKEGIKDPRFVVQHAGEELSLVTRTSDGQMLFLVNKLQKMKQGSRLGSRIAEVHNGSALFTGDAGQGESNIRRWIIENDWLEAIVALPLNIFYNTGIATYVWVLTNRKPPHRRGKVQLIDATAWFKPLRRNLGNKNCELSVEDIRRVCDAYLTFDETEQSKLFPNAAFGYRKVTVERPLRLRVELTPERIAAFRASGGDPALADLAERFVARYGDGSGRFRNEERGPDVETTERTTPRDEPGIYRRYDALLEALQDENRRKLTSKQVKTLREAFCVRDERAEPVRASARLAHSDTPPSDIERLYGSFPDRSLFPMVPEGVQLLLSPPDPLVVTYEPDPELRDTEQIPLLEPGGVLGFIAREVWPHAADAWVDPNSERIGYEISFTRYFHKPKPLRSLAEIEADIRALEAETEGLLDEVLVSVE
jgi:type I restriction enzyme M protein